MHDDVYPLFQEYRSWLAGDSEELSYAAEYWYLSSTTTDGIIVSEEKIESILENVE